MNPLERAMAAVDAHSSWSGVHLWAAHLRVDPKWHKKDRLRISGRPPGGKPTTFCEAHFRLRKDGVGLLFRPGGDEIGEDWHELVLPKEWDRTAASSAVWTCVFLGAVPKEAQRPALGWRTEEPVVDYHGEPDPVTTRKLVGVGHHEVKELQSRLRKCTVYVAKAPAPPCVKHALDLLETRFGGLTGVDVREQIQKLEWPFKFLQSKGVPFERIRQAWDEAAVAEVMEE